MAATLDVILGRLFHKAIIHGRDLRRSAEMVLRRCFISCCSGFPDDCPELVVH